MKTAVSYMDPKIRPIKDDFRTSFKIHIGAAGSQNGRIYKDAYTKDNPQRSIYEAYNQIGSRWGS